MSKTSQISNFRCKHLRKTLQLMLAITGIQVGVHTDVQYIHHKIKKMAMC